MRNIQQSRDLAQQQYNHLAESWRGLWIPFSYPYQIILGNIIDWIMKAYIYDVGKLVGHGNRLKIWELAVCLIGVTFDDLGTARGMQGEEWKTPESNWMYEANPTMAAWWLTLIRWGIVSTETSAMRFTHIMNFTMILVAQYFGFFTPVSRYTVMLLSLQKAYAGRLWWTIPYPNNFSFIDYFTFKPGVRTTWRLSEAMINLQHAHFISSPQIQQQIQIRIPGYERRRLFSKPLDTSYTNLLTELKWFMFH